MVDAFLTVVFDNLNSLVQQELGSLWGVNGQMERLSSTLSIIRAVIEDAEEKQLNGDDRVIKNWLGKLSDASHVLDDVLDKFAMEASRVEYEKQESRWKKLIACSSFSSFSGPANPLFRWTIAKEMRVVSERLDEIANERLKFHLREVVGERKSRLRERRQSSSFVTQPKVYGREEDREKVVHFLLSDVRNCKDVSIYPFVGMGGIGKTTLAQLVFNDKTVCEHFELRVWVYVSEDFDVKRVMKAIIESSTGSACDYALEMDPLARRLREIFQGKKFLIVLDDIWNEDQEQWDRLKYILNCGSVGSSIIVTTRLKKVAAIMGTTPTHRLLGLSEDDCWSLFKQRAFGDEKEEHPKLVKIGKEIVRKCGGVPLAAKALGGLMRFKRDESEWISVMHSELWDVLRDENSVLPALRLSYLSLPVEQRRCFSFCALFPKNSRIEKECLIRLWMANGFISSPGQVEAEEIGSQIFDELNWRSFFQDYKKDYFGNWSFKMHDLVHDLALSIMEDECYHENVNDKKPGKLPTRVRYLASTYSEQPSYIPTCKSLRTLILLSKDYRPLSLDCHSNFPSLRALDVEHFSLKSISSIISTSKHLRYLNLSYTDIKILPESICNLQNLQTLNLTGCGQIQRLPNNLHRLRNLRHLNIFGCVQLSRMPRHIRRLTSLRTLNFFIVDDKEGCRLDELENLSLGGDLELKGLEKVRSSTVARKANLVSKTNINKLSLCWGKEETKFIEMVDQVLEALEPSQSLNVLEIKNYEGVIFPHWMSNGILQNVVSITLSTFKNCSNLPALNKLPLLKYLYIHQMDRVRYMDYDEPPSVFTSLENLMIRNLSNLEILTKYHEEVKIFPCLSELYISHCYKLTTLPFIPSLKKLEVWKSHKGLLDSVPNLHNLTSLDVSKIDGVTHLPDRFLQNLTSLQTLRMAYFPDLQELPSTMLISLKSLERIQIRYCDQLVCFPDEFFQSFNNLKCLTIENCKKLRSLSESFRYLTALQSLDLCGCPELTDLPNGLKNFSSLRHLNLSGQCRSTSQCSTSKMEVLPESLQYLPSLESMIICDFPNLKSLPDWIGNLVSLRELLVRNCPTLVSMPTSIQHLSNLQTLSIESCPKLQETCGRETGEDRNKIAHIPNVFV